MRGRRLSWVMILLFVVSIWPAPVRSSPTHDIVYTQWWDYGSCIVGPVVPHVTGEWISTCNGGWYGWGWQPGHSCTYTVVSQGDPC